MCPLGPAEVERLLSMLGELDRAVAQLGGFGLRPQEIHKVT
jgi:hypothetical protein